MIRSSRQIDATWLKRVYKDEKGHLKKDVKAHFTSLY